MLKRALRVRVLGLVIVVVWPAACADGATTTTVASHTEAPASEDSDHVVGAYDENLAVTFTSLEDLRDLSEVIAVFTITGQHEGRITSDNPDERTVQRILELQVEEPIKGAERGDELRVWDGSWSYHSARTGAWERVALTVVTDGYELEPGDRVIMALVPDPGDSEVFALQSSGAYFLTSANDPNGFVPIERSNPVAAAAQERPVQDIVDTLRG